MQDRVKTHEELHGVVLGRRYVDATTPLMAVTVQGLVCTRLCAHVLVLVVAFSLPA